MKSESSMNANLNFESILNANLNFETFFFIKNHKSESKNNENINCE